MKILSIAIVLSIAGVMSLPAQTATGRANTPEPTAYAVTTRDGNSQVWQRTTYETGPGGKIVPRIHQYTELATGLNHQVNGQWVASDETITILPDGTAAATNGQHQAYFPSDIYNGEIKLVTPDGKVLQSQPVGLSYDDGSNTVLIAILTNSVGQLVSSNQIIYPDAFVGINADLRYTYRKSGFEQDVILHEQPPAPATLGLNQRTTRIQVMTEFFNPSAPVVRAKRVQTKAGELENDQLIFGAMQMVQGRAFLMGTNSSSEPVDKQWMQMSGRQFLVEQVPTAAMAEDLENLPVPVNQTRIATPLRVASGHLTLPAQHLAKTTPAPRSRSIRLAKVTLPKHGLVLDYQMLNSSLTDYTFQGDTTYYISGIIYLSGNTILEGGTVLKYPENGSGCLVPDYQDLITCKTASYHPAVFTSVNDNSVGETISSSTGSPAQSSYSPQNYEAYLSFQDNSGLAQCMLNNIRASYAGCAIEDDFEDGSVQWIISDSQFFNCNYALNSWSSRFVFINDLLSDCYFTINQCNGGDVQLDQVTVDHSRYLINDEGYMENSTIELTNSILSSVTNMIGSAGNPYTYKAVVTLQNSLIAGTNNQANIVYSQNSYQPSSASGIYQTVGGGNHYLAVNSPYRNFGTTNIDPGLLADLAYKTTYPPIAYTNLTFSTVQNFLPQAQRDNIGNPDLGYHYDPLDYTFGGCTITTNVTFSAGTAVGWFRTTSGWTHAGQGIQLSGNITVAFNGTATLPDYWVRLNTVQENDQTAGYGHGSFESWASPPIPTVTGNFLHCSVMTGEDYNSYFADDYGTIQANMMNSEFWSGSLIPYGDYMTYSNCLMWRLTQVGVNNGLSAGVFTMRNCTMIGGSFSMNRNDSYGLGALPVSVRDCSFDGTSISTADTYGSDSSVTDYNYNSYTNTIDPFSIGGANDVIVTNGFNWQSSWFGNYYLPSDSLLIDAGSTTADQVGLYHFTTQTNQTPEYTSPVDIGYHYVATDSNGNPLDSNSDGIPDYLEDANGNGLVDSGEIGWNINGDIGLQVIITKPRNGSVLP